MPRLLKDWTDSEPVDNLSLHAEVFFTRLIMKADDYGNYTGNIKLINAALFPLKGYDPYNVEGWLDECVNAGLVSKYQVDGKALIHIKNFDQKLRRMHAAYPPPPDGQARTSDGQVTDIERTSADKRPPELEEKRREEEVEEKVKTREWFNSCIDEIFKERLLITHKGKDIDQAMAEAWTHLSADGARLRAAKSSDVKKLVNTWLGHMKTNGKPTRVQSFNLKDV